MEKFVSNSSRRKRNQPRRREAEKYTKKNLIILLRDLTSSGAPRVSCLFFFVVDFSDSFPMKRNYFN